MEAIKIIGMVTMTPFIQVEDSFMQKLLVGYALIISFMAGTSTSCSFNVLTNK